MFELTIKCTKDINEIHINFADGSSVITGADKTEDSNDSVSSTTSKNTKTKSNDKKPKPEKFMDLEADFNQVSQEVVELPDITTEKRSIKVASELQNLDI